MRDLHVATYGGEEHLIALPWFVSSHFVFFGWSQVICDGVFGLHESTGNTFFIFVHESGSGWTRMRFLLLMCLVLRGWGQQKNPPFSRVQQT